MDERERKILPQNCIVGSDCSNIVDCGGGDREFRHEGGFLEGSETQAGETESLNSPTNNKIYVNRRAVMQCDR